MKKIENIDKLLAEKRMLKNKLIVLEKEITNDWEQLSESFKPLNLLKNLGDGSGPGPANKSSMLKNSMNIGLDILLGKLLLKNKSLIFKMVVPYLVKNFAGTILTERSGSLLKWVRSRFSKKPTNGVVEQRFDESTADVNTAAW